MADQQKQQTGANRFSSEDMSLIQTIVQAAVEAAKKPYIDEDEVAKKEKARQRLRSQQREATEAIEAAQSVCSHMREDNTSRIAWHQQYHRAKGLYIIDGFCQHCNKHYEPGVPGYEEMLRVPVGKSGLVNA